MFVGGNTYSLGQWHSRNLARRHAGNGPTAIHVALEAADMQQLRLVWSLAGELAEHGRAARHSAGSKQFDRHVILWSQALEVIAP